MTATDINKNAIFKAKENAEKNKVLDRISFIESDLFQNVTEKFDIIISNPPYIKTNIIHQLDDNVKNYEPKLALDGGEDGLIFYKKITSKANEYLAENGFIMYEIGYDQAEDVTQILIENNFNNIEVLKDLAGLDRVIIGKKLRR